MTEAALALIGGAIDSKGLAVDIPDEQLDTAAEQLGTVDGAIDLAKADLYIRKCAALGISAGGDRKSENQIPDVRILIELDLFCIKLNSSRKQMQNWAAICRSWKRGDRLAGMTIGHYESVAGMKREAARQLLARAQMGDPKTNWSEQQPPAPWKMWSVARLRKERKADEGNAVARADCNVVVAGLESKNAILDDVAKTLGEPTEKNKKILGKIERGVDKAFKEMGFQYKSAMDVEITRRIQFEREQAAEKVAEANKARETYETAVQGVARPIEKDELRILRQFCHPDKHPGNEAKAGQAYEIVETIGKRLQLSSKQARNG